MRHRRSRARAWVSGLAALLALRLGPTCLAWQAYPSKSLQLRPARQLAVARAGLQRAGSLGVRLVLVHPLVLRMAASCPGISSYFWVCGKQRPTAAAALLYLGQRVEAMLGRRRAHCRGAQGRGRH